MLIEQDYADAYAGREENYIQDYVRRTQANPENLYIVSKATDTGRTLFMLYQKETDDLGLISTVVLGGDTIIEAVLDTEVSLSE